MTNYIFTDYDGVYAPIAQMPGEQVWDKRDVFEMEESHGATHSYYIYPEMVRRINTLSTWKDTSVQWLTTWRDEIEAINQMLGVSYMNAEMTLRDLSSRFSDDFKFRAILNAANLGNRVVWCEDEISEDAVLHFGIDKSLPVSEISYGNGSILVIAPNSHEGMTPDQMDAIEEYVMRDS